MKRVLKCSPGEAEQKYVVESSALVPFLTVNWKKHRDAVALKKCPILLPVLPPSSFGRDAWSRGHTTQVGMKALLAVFGTPGPPNRCSDKDAGRRDCETP